MTRRNPDNQRKTVNNHFYLPEFGAFGQEEYDQYNLARENLDRFLREIYDRSYTLPSVKGYRLSPPEIDWFYSLHGMPHWRTIRGFWKFEQEAGDPQAVDSSIYGHGGGSPYAALVTPGAWHQLSSEDNLPGGFFLEDGDSCIRARSAIHDNIAAEIPGILHSYPTNPLTGKKELTIEFWWSPSFNIYGGDRDGGGATYPASACLLSKINRFLISEENRWVSDELTLQLLPVNQDCEFTSGPLSFNTHRFQPTFTPDGECDFSDWGYAQSAQSKWNKQEWYYVAATWSEETGMTISVNLQQDPVFGFDANALQMPNDGIVSNLVIGNYWNRFKTNQGIDALFSEMRISSKVRTPAEQAYAFNSGYGRRMEPDAYTLGLWHFDEGQGAYGFNSYVTQTENLPTFGVPGIVKKGYIYQPEEEGSSSGEGISAPESSQEITYAADFVRAQEQYLDVGQGDWLNMQSFGGEVCYKFASTFCVKRNSLGTRQAVISKWAENEGKQFWIGFNEDDQIEVRLGKGADVEVERVTEVISNPYDYAVVSGSGIRDFDGVYVSEEGYNILNSSNSEEDSSSWGPYGAVSLSECDIPELNGWYDFVSVEGNDGVPAHPYPYVEISGAGIPPVDGEYVSEDDWESARTVYEDPSLPFPNIKIEGAHLYSETGYPIDSPTVPEGSSSEEPSDIDFNGVYVPEEYWSQAKDAILGPGAPDPSPSLTWQVTSNQGTYAVWRKVDSERDIAIYHAGSAWDGYILGLDVDPNQAFYYSYRMKHDQPPLTWFTMSYLGIQDDNIRAYRSEEFYEQNLVNISKWVGAGQPIWRNVDNPDLEIYLEATSYEQWILGIFESVAPANLYWAPFVDEEFPLNFYLSTLGKDPGPSSRIYNYPQLQGGDGRTIWRHRDNPEYYIYRDNSPWELGWAAWFIGKGTDHQENYFFAEWHRGQTDIIPPSQWFNDYYAQGPTPVLRQYPLDWTVNGRPIYRNAANPEYCIYQNVHPDSSWFGWFMGKGADAVNAMWWSDDNKPFIPPTWYVMNNPDASPVSPLHFYDQYLPSDERPDPNDTPVVEPNPKDAEITSVQRVVKRPAGIEEFVAVSEDKIEDTERFHQVVVSWSKHYYNGAPQIFIDGEEVSAYVRQDEHRGNMPYLDAEGDVGQWAPMNIGRTFDVGSSSSSQEDPPEEPSLVEESSSGLPFVPVPPQPVGNPDDYLDATLDEVAIFATRLIDVEVRSLWDHLVEGAQDGDRWYVDDPNLRIVSGNELVDEYGDVVGDRLSDPATGEWEGYKEYFADWRRDAVTGEYGWYFHPVEFSGVFWNQEAGRLESWLPDEYFELWGDYGVQGTGNFNIG